MNTATLRTKARRETKAAKIHLSTCISIQATVKRMKIPKMMSSIFLIVNTGTFVNSFSVLHNTNSLLPLQCRADMKSARAILRLHATVYLSVYSGAS